jgi:hypothetical protein
MNALRRRFALGMLATILPASLPQAWAQQSTGAGAASPSGAEPQRVVTATGTVQRFTKSATGAPDGFVLEDGTMVHFPAYLSQQVTALIAPNAQVRVTGVMPEVAGTNAPRLLEARTITDLSSNRTVTVTGSAGTQPGATVSGDSPAAAAGAAGPTGGGAAAGGAAGGGAAGGAGAGAGAAGGTR